MLVKFLYDDIFGVVVGFFFIIIYVYWFWCVVGISSVFVFSGVVLYFLVKFLDFVNDIIESFVDVNVGFGGCFDKFVVK